jgi:hypothetical protein
MIRTKKAISKDDIPSSWIFEHYLMLDEKLHGQHLKIKSVFNKTEKTPSMFIFPCADQVYRFKDFSSGHSGDAYELVSRIYGIRYGEAIEKVLKDFNDSGRPLPELELKLEISSAYQLIDYEARNWNTIDAKYWTQYGIGSKTLSKYNVMPLKSYKLQKENDVINLERAYMYGYFKGDGLMYKVYQPKNKQRKFLKVRNYIQGYDQLTFEKPNLVIHSSLKDIMAFEELKFKTIDCIAPDSENSRIPNKLMWELIEKYDTVTTIFDNDDAGRKAVERYKSEYGINGFVLDMEKDVSDSIARYGKDHVKDNLIPLLTESIYTCRRCKGTSTLA